MKHLSYEPKFHKKNEFVNFCAQPHNYEMTLWILGIEVSVSTIVKNPNDLISETHDVKDGLLNVRVSFNKQMYMKRWQQRLYVYCFNSILTSDQLFVQYEIKHIQPQLGCVENSLGVIKIWQNKHFWMVLKHNFWMNDVGSVIVINHSNLIR